MVSPHIVYGNGAKTVDRSDQQRATIRRTLRTVGAVLLRGFRVGGAEGLEATVRDLSGPPLEYTERSSPRSTIHGRVYTSTDYPPAEEIFLHNENSYQTSWPLTLFFHCVVPPTTLGATPLADTRQVLANIDPSVVEEFTWRRWMVARTYREDLGLPWQYVFGTNDRTQVERYCAAHGLSVRWRGDGVLRTTAVRDAVHRHPISGERV